MPHSAVVRWGIRSRSPAERRSATHKLSLIARGDSKFPGSLCFSALGTLPATLPPPTTPGANGGSTAFFFPSSGVFYLAPLRMADGVPSRLNPPCAMLSALLERQIATARIIPEPRGLITHPASRSDGRVEPRKSAVLDGRRQARGTAQGSSGTYVYVATGPQAPTGREAIAATAVAGRRFLKAVDWPQQSPPAQNRTTPLFGPSGRRSAGKHASAFAPRDSTSHQT